MPVTESDWHWRDGKKVAPSPEVRPCPGITKAEYDLLTDRPTVHLHCPGCAPGGRGALTLTDSIAMERAINLANLFGYPGNARALRSLLDRLTRPEER